MRHNAKRELPYRRFIFRKSKICFGPRRKMRHHAKNFNLVTRCSKNYDGYHLMNVHIMRIMKKEPKSRGARELLKLSSDITLSRSIGNDLTFRFLEPSTKTELVTEQSTFAPLIYDKSKDLLFYFDFKKGKFDIKKY